MTLLPLQGVCMEKHQAAFSQPNVTVRITKSIYWPGNNSDRVRPGVMACGCKRKSARLTAFNGPSTGVPSISPRIKEPAAQSHHIE
jgi:hypothetical protein